MSNTIGARRRNVVSRLSFRGKLILSFCISVFVPLLLVGIVNLLVVRRNVEAELRTAVQNSTTRTQLGISRVLTAMRSAYYILNYPEPPFLDGSLTLSDRLDTETVRRLQEYDWVVGGIEAGFGIQRVRLFLDSPSPFLDNERYLPLEKMAVLPQRSQDELARGAVWWTTPYSPAYTRSGAPTVISLAGPIVRNGRDRSDRGFIFIDSSTIPIQRAIDSLADQYAARVYLVDENNEVLVAGGAGRDGPRPLDLETTPADAIIARSTIEVAGWSLVTVAPAAQGPGYPVWSGRLLLGGFILASVAAGVWIAYSSRSLASRVEALADAVERSGLDTVDPVVNVKSKSDDDAGSDEIDALLASYNSMVERVRYLVGEVYRYETEIQTASITALHSQISSHFVFNTLESISASSRANKSQRTIGMAENLATFIRATMSGTNQLTLLETELSMLSAYVDLVSDIYGLAIQYRVQCPSELLNVTVLRFVLQPIVENAITHGFRQAGRKEGRIDVAVAATERELSICITDDGTGMDGQALKSLRVALRSAAPINSSDPMGLRNIHRRLHLEFGAEYGISVDPGSDGGLRVIVDLPLIDGESA